MHNACPGLSSGTVPLPGDAQYRPGGGGAKKRGRRGRGKEEGGGGGGGGGGGNLLKADAVNEEDSERDRATQEEEAEFIRIQWMLF